MFMKIRQKMAIITKVNMYIFGSVTSSGQG